MVLLFFLALSHNARLGYRVLCKLWSSAKGVTAAYGQMGQGG